MKKTVAVPVILLALAAAVFPAPKRKTPGLAEFAGSLSGMDMRDGRHRFTGRVYEFSEAELNAYIRSLLQKKKLQFDVSRAEISLLPGNIFRLYAAVNMDFKKIFGATGNNLTAKALEKASALGSSFYVEGLISSAKGRGTVIIREIKINGLRLPDDMVRILLRYIGENQRPKVDFTFLNDLPYGISKIEIEKSLIRVRF